MSGDPVLTCLRGELPPALRTSLAGWIWAQGLPAVPAGAVAADGEDWLLLEQPRGAQPAAPLALLRLRPRLGLRLPRYSYHVGCAVHAAAELGLYQSQATLLLGNDHTGCSELDHIAHAPGADPAVLLPQLIAAALRQIAARPADYGPRLIVELGGPRDAAGQSPFWQGLGGRFYGGDWRAASQRWGEAWSSHLAALLPRQTLYLSFLESAAQAALGRPQAGAAPLVQALRMAGFGDSDHVRIDDGGPIWSLALAR